MLSRVFLCHYALPLHPAAGRVAAMCGRRATFTKPRAQSGGGGGGGGGDAGGEAAAVWEWPRFCDRHRRTGDRRCAAQRP